MKKPNYSSKISFIAIDDVMQDGVPRVAPGAQRPLEIKAWRRKTGTFDERHLGVPGLICLDGVLYVTDGQHRIMEMSVHGITHFRAEVSVGDDAAAAASDFLGYNTNKPVTRREKTQVSITAEDVTWTEIMKILARYDFELRKPRGLTRLPQGHYRLLECDATLERLHNMGVLDHVLWVYGNLPEHWSASSGAPSTFLSKLGSFLAEHDADLPRLVRELSKTSLVTLEQNIAKKMVETGGARSELYVWLLVDLYNKGLTATSDLRLKKKSI